MPRRAFAPRARAGRKIDFKNWEDIPAIDLSSTAAETIIGPSLNFGIPATILRVRGNLVVFFDGAADTSQQNVAMGLAVLSTDAVAAGAGSVPDPAAEAEFPWLWWTSVPIAHHVVGAAVLQDLAFARVVVDSKAMRKVKPGESLVIVYQTTAAITTTRIDQSHIRVLIGT